MPAPPFKITCPCSILPPLFKNFLDPPLPPKEVFKIYSPPFKKGGSELCSLNWEGVVQRSLTTLVNSLAYPKLYQIVVQVHLKNKLSYEVRFLLMVKHPYKLEIYSIIFNYSSEACLKLFKATSQFPANIYLFKVSNRNTRKRCEICSKLTIKMPERCQWHRSGFFYC